MNKILTLSELQTWLITNGLSILLILVLGFVAQIIAKYFIERVIRKVVGHNHDITEYAERRRENTLINVANGTIRVLIWILVFIMILSQIGIEVGPLLAAAGIVGVAVGFGGQYLVRDIITGIFIILENQYRVGDVVCIGNKCGAVESINLRLTVIRDMDGVVHHIPNGEVSIASNLTKQFSRVHLDVGVGYEAPLEKVIEVTNEVGNDLANDPDWSDKIISPPQFLRVDEFGDSAVIIKILGDTKPSEQWVVTGEFRKRLKIAYDKNDISIPYPHRVVQMTKS